MIKTRQMQVQEIAAGMRLKIMAGWNQVEQDWHLFLTLSPEGCFVAVHDGQVVGTVTTVKYEDALSWIGMLLVDPVQRRRGIGTLLMRRAIASLEACRTIKLDATPTGKSLYARLGFEDECRLQRMTIDRLPRLPEPPPDVRPIVDEAFGQVTALDRRIFGADRALVLRALRERAPGSAWQRIRRGRTRGFCLGRRGAIYDQIGPLIAETVDDAIALCTAAMRNLVGRAAVLDVFEAQDRFLAWLRDLGFVEQRSFTRMYRGQDGTLGMSKGQYAIAGPELG